VREADRVAKLRFPKPAACGRTPLMASGLSKSYGSLEIFTDVDLAIDRGSKVVVLGLNGAGKTTLLRMLAGVDEPDTGQLEPGHGLKVGYYAQEHENLDVDRSVLQNMVSAAPHITETEARKVLGSFLFTGDDVLKPAGVLSGGEKTRLSLATLVVSSANLLLLDEPTNNLDPASRSSTRSRTTRAPSCSYRTTPVPSRRSTRSACSSSPTASRTSGTRSTRSSSSSRRAGPPASRAPLRDTEGSRRDGTWHGPSQRESSVSMCAAMRATTSASMRSESCHPSRRSE